MNDFELEKRLSNPEFVNQRFAEIIKAVINLDEVSEKAYGEKRSNGFDEHIARLNPTRPKSVSPQLSMKAEYEQRQQQALSEDEAAARALVENAYSGAFIQQPRAVKATVSQEHYADAGMVAEAQDKVNRVFDEIFTEQPALNHDNLDLQEQ